MKARTRHLLGFVAFLGLLAACDRNRERTSTSNTTTVTGANVASVTTDAAIGRVVEARCAREVSCNNVGADKTYESRDLCTQKIKVDMKQDLSASDCPQGIDQKELDECLSAIHGESCNNPIEKIERLAACRTSDLCLKTPGPNR